MEKKTEQETKTIEIRWHGRGGQGVITAAKILAESALKARKYFQAMPEYGAERTGAPIRAYTRISSVPVIVYCGVVNPDIVIVLDPTLVGVVNITEGLKEGGILIVNTPLSPKELRTKLNFAKGKIYTVNATKIALDLLGKGIPNIAMLGALLRATNVIKRENLLDKIRSKLGETLKKQIVEENIQAFEMAYNETQAEEEEEKTLTYKDAGVDIEEAGKSVRRIKELAKTTYSSNVMAGIGPFGAIYDFKEILLKYLHPVLVFSVDGVGTKIEIARTMNSLGSIGTDIVNHCINDILCQGAKPLVFLDYIAQHKLCRNEIEEIIQGMTAACREAEISLIGGETAQLQGLLKRNCSDVVGFIAGIVEKNKIIDGHFIEPGDKILGLVSSGLHTNGYSLLGKIFSSRELKEELGETLLTPHRSYFGPLSVLFNERDELGFYFNIHGIAHITGGGLKENIGRILPEGCRAEIRLGSWPILPIFQLIRQRGKITTEEMFRVFNMGIGLVLIVSRLEVSALYKILWQNAQPAYLLGEIKQGEKEVIFQ